MIRYKKCAFGPLSVNDLEQGQAHTNNPLNINPSWFKLGRDSSEAFNCFLGQIPIIGRPGTLNLESPLEDLSKCEYTQEHCKLANGAMVVWNLKAILNAVGRNPQCPFVRMITQMGTYTKGVWLSKDAERSLVFETDAKHVTSCQKELVISLSGFAIPYHQYETLMSAPQDKSRDKRQTEYVSIPEMVTHLQAEALYQNKELKKLLKTIVEMLCHNLDSDIKGGTHLQGLNPVQLIRKKLGTEFLEGRWVSETLRILAVFPGEFHLDPFVDRRMP